MALSRHLLGGTEENYEQTRSGKPISGPRDEPGASRIRNKSASFEPDVRFEVPIVHSMKKKTLTCPAQTVYLTFLRNLFGKLLDSCILRKHGGK
jgi:hypothetical protein